MAIKLTSSKLTKDLARRTKLVHHLDRALNDWDGPFTFDYESKEIDNAFHPSGDCTPSVAELYERAVRFLDADPDRLVRAPVTPALRKTFLVGHFWHQFLQHLIVDRLGFASPDEVERRGIKVWNWWESDASQMMYWDDHNPHIELYNAPDGHRPAPFGWATGSADIAPCHIPGYGEAIVDFKTMNARDYGRNEAPTWAVDKWEAQLNIYMDWFDLEKALIVGINKDSPHEFKEFEFVRNDKLIEAIYHKWDYVGYFLDNADIPNAADDIDLPFKGVYE